MTTETAKPLQLEEDDSFGETLEDNLVVKRRVLQQQKKEPSTARTATSNVFGDLDTYFNKIPKNSALRIICSFRLKEAVQPKDKKITAYTNRVYTFYWCMENKTYWWESRKITEMPSMFKWGPFNGYEEAFESIFEILGDSLVNRLERVT